jgi:hypothetical protein
MWIERLIIIAALAINAHAVDFTRDVRPILASKCYACHGPDEESREADLRLDMPAEHFDTKTFLHRITTANPDDVMPPPKSPKPLTAAEKDVLRQWIAAGAKYEPHWAFQPIQNLKSHHDIDSFIRAELTKHGLQPAPRADASTLIRRLYLDLIGLPPPSDSTDLTDEK